ncbi:MAG: SDR family NAD(P)-dependent oxidoreductase [Anaerolineae bacterium]
MHILVTGGAGFIGSNLAARLVALGNKVVILDNFDEYYDPDIKRNNIATLQNHAAIVEGDIRDERLVERLYKEYRITHVAHLAGMSGVRYSITHGNLYADVNTRGSVVLLDAASKHNIEMFVLASTSSVYGETTRIPFVEDDAAMMPLAPYPASKRAAELFARSYHHLFGLNVTVTRFFNVYGPRGRVDMMPLRTIEAILHQQAIPIYNNGTLERDWTYIDDLVNGLLLALEKPLGYEIFNLGYGNPISLNRFIHIYEQLMSKRAIVQNVPAPLSEPPITYCDNTRARQLLGFDPCIPIEEGLARTWQWYQDTHDI